MSASTGVNADLVAPKKGEPVTADFLQSLADNVRRLSQAGRAANVTITANGAGIFIDAVPPDDLFTFWNGDGANTIPAYGICLTNGTKTNGSYVLPQAKQPDTYGCQTNFIVNGSMPVKPTAPGGGQRGPFFLIAYNNADGGFSTDDRWGPRSGSYLLRKNTGGFKLLNIWDSVNHIAIAVQEPMITVRGTIASDLAPDAHGDLTVYTGAFGSETTTSQTITSVYNKSDCTLKSGSSKIHTAIQCTDNGGWQFVVGRTV